MRPDQLGIDMARSMNSSFSFCAKSRAVEWPWMSVSLIKKRSGDISTKADLTSSHPTS